MRLFFLSLLGLILAAVPVSAALAADYKFDSAHTNILFFVDHLGFAKSYGEFHEFDGGFTFDPENVESSSVNVTIETASIDMGSEKWDAHMKNADFFDVENYPEMTFKSTEIEKTGENTGKLTGDLTLLGVTRPVTLDVTYNSTGVHPYSKNTVAGFSATGPLVRSNWGMKYGLPGIGDEIELRIEVEGIQEQPAPPNE